MHFKYIAHIREPDLEIQPLAEHLKSVSRLCSKFTNDIGCYDIGLLIGILHDIGKYGQEFQDYILNSDISKKGKIDHSTSGAQYAWNYYSEKGNIETKIAQIISIIIASHHNKGLINCITPDGYDNFCRRISLPDEKTHLNEVLGNIDPEIKLKLDRLLNNSNLISSLIGIIVRIYQYSGNTENTIYHFHTGLLTRFLFSCLVDADRLDTANFECPWKTSIRQNNEYVNWQILIDKLERQIKSFSCESDIDKIRNKIHRNCIKKSENPTGIFTLTSPTGSGKTLSFMGFALHHAKKYNMKRIIVVMPYTTIIEQNADVYRKIFEENSYDNIVLEHHSNIVYENNKDQWKKNILIDNWDSPIVLTTSVQLLECLFGGNNRNIRRMHQLANSIIIFDEIQCLPLKTVHLFNNAMNFLTEFCGSTFMLSTATQPLLDKVNKDKGCLTLKPENELIEDTNKTFSKLRRVEIVNKIKTDGYWSDEEAIDLAEDKLIKNNGKGLIIVNTKPKARSLYEESKRLDVAHLYHLSANMCPIHRSFMINDIRERLKQNASVLCITTQLIEAGVDIDFPDGGIRSNAGLPSLGQGSGRCNREGSRETTKLFVINLNENLQNLLDIRIGAAVTERLFREFEANPELFDYDLLSPKSMERYFKYYFHERADEMSYPITGNGNDTLLNMLSSNSVAYNEYKRINKNNNSGSFLRQSFTAVGENFNVIGGGTHGIIAPYKEQGRTLIKEICKSKNIEEEYKLLKQAQRYSINIYTQMIDRYIEEDIIYESHPESGVFCLREEYYNDEYGLSEEMNPTTEGLIL